MSDEIARLREDAELYQGLPKYKEVIASFNYTSQVGHTPTITVTFGINDWDSRDRFKEALLKIIDAARGKP